ncbi:MAG: MoaD/ThiS family protein [Betaproteobacteria bacterium]|nr:MoaD/ThiS family protein [Betaproteobacteria bacterium]
MPVVEITRHLHRFFPALQGATIEVPAGSVAEVLRAVDARAPGFSDYVLDERGALRRHVALSIDRRVVIDRERLSDQVPDGAVLHVFQALTGG